MKNTIFIVKIAVFLGITIFFTPTAHASEDALMTAGYSPIIRDISAYKLAPQAPIEITDSMLMAGNSHVINKKPSIVRYNRVGTGIVARIMTVTSTGYNSEEAQTDSSPFISADGSHVYDGMVAANFLPFGTKIRIPDYYGDKTFEVHDRMNKRFSDRVDVWFENKGDAMKWGRRTVTIEVLGN